MTNKDCEDQKLKDISKIDRIIHEPSRFLILSYLAVIENTDFLFLMNQTDLTRGNLSSHLSKLEAANYIEIKKEFIYKIPRTLIRMNKRGREAFSLYRRKMKNFLENMPE
ncbi:winged helix-turn-helix domain-containing protein [Acidobacteriota bacterium]